MELPQHKHDLERARAFEDCSLDELATHLGGLLEWIQDINWPVARVVLPVLARSDGRIVPHILAILSGDDDGWKYWVIDALAPRLDPLVRRELVDAVTRIASEPTAGEVAEEVHLVAASWLESQQPAS